MSAMCVTPYSVYDQVTTLGSLAQRQHDLDDLLHPMSLLPLPPGKGKEGTRAIVSQRRRAMQRSFRWGCQVTLEEPLAISDIFVHSSG